MTQTERILDLLRDGRWHTTREILHAVPCIVHSRVSDLRAKGHLIEHRGHGGGADRNEYRLLGLLDETASLSQFGAVSSSGTEGHDPNAASAGGVPPSPVPLTLFHQAAA